MIGGRKKLRFCRILEVGRRRIGNNVFVVQRCSVEAQERKKVQKRKRHRNEKGHRNKKRHRNEKRHRFKLDYAQTERYGESNVNG